MRATLDGRLDRLLWVDLLGVPYADRGRSKRTGFDCFGLVLEVQRRLGREVADDVAYASSGAPGDTSARMLATGAWEAIADPEPGDCVLAQIDDPDYPDHVGVLVGPDEVLQVTVNARSVVRPLSDWRERGWFRGFYRPCPDKVRTSANTRGGPIRVLFMPDPIGSPTPETILAEWREGLTAWDLVPHHTLHESAYARLQLRHNGWAITEAEARARQVAPGDELLVRLDPAVPAAIFVAAGPEVTTGAILAAAAVNFVIAGIVGVVASLIAAPKPPRLDKKDEDGSPTFNLGAIGNTVANGTTVAVGYGQHRTGGQILSALIEIDAQFRSTLFLLIGKGEGEVQDIGGVSGDFDQLPVTAFAGNAIEIDGNPIGSYPAARVSLRMGKTRQSIIPGFEQNGTAFGQDTNLRATSPLVPGQAAIPNNDQTFLYTTTQPVDGFALLIQYPIGLYKIDAQTGTEIDYSVFYTVRYQRKGNAASEVVEVIQHGPSARKSDHTRAIKHLGLPLDVYEIRITRMSDNDENLQRRFSTSKLIAVNEYVSDTPVAHNSKALLALEFLNTGQFSGQVPRVTSVDRMKKVHVWDGVSATSPAFTFQWSDNPAWVMLDIITQKRYGLGTFYNLRHVDLAALKALADYCDESLTTSGVTHPRWQFNYYFDGKSSAWDAIALVAASCRSNVSMVGGRFTVTIERAASPTMLFSMGNIIAGSMVAHYPKTLDRPNIVKVQYRNARLDYDSDVAQLDNLQAGEQFIPKDFSLFGITNPEQAYRACQFLLNVARNTDRGLTWRAPIDSIACNVGQVVAVEHDVLMVGAAGGRLSGVDNGGSIVRLDRAVAIPASPAWALKVQSYDSVTGTMVQQTFVPTPGTYAAGADIPFTPPVGVNLSAKDVYAIGASTSYVTEERITRIRRTKRQQAEIDSLRYVAANYDDDPGEIEGFTDVYPNPRVHPANPTGLRLVENTAVLADGTVAHAIDVSFVPTQDGHTHDVWVRPMRDEDTGETDERPNREGEDWRYAGATTIGQLKIREGIEPKRAYMVSITPRSPSGNRTDPAAGASGIVVPMGRVDFPAAPTNLRAEQLSDGRLRVQWTASTSRDVAHYEVRVCYGSGDARKWLLSQVVAPCVCGTEAIFLPPKYAALYVLVDAITTTGATCLLPASVAVTAAGRGLVVLGATTESAAWPGTKTNMAVSGTSVRSDAGASSGSYQSGNTTFALNTMGGLLSIFLEASAWSVDWTVDDAGYLTASTHAQRLRTDGLLFDVPEPDQVLAWTDDHNPVDGPGCYIRSVTGAIDWPTRLSIAIQYDLASDSGATVWDGWRDYLGPVQIPTGRYWCRVKATFLTPSGGKIRVYFDQLVVTQTAPAAAAIAATDPNGHFRSSPDTVDGHLIELGWGLAEGTARWPRVPLATWVLPGGPLNYDGTADLYGVEAVAGADTDIGYLTTRIPRWYQADGSKHFTLELYYFILGSKPSSQDVEIETQHRTFVEGDSSFPAMTTVTSTITIPGSETDFAPRKASIDITSGAFGGSHTQFELRVRRLSTDSFEFSFFIYGIAIVSGVKST